MDTYYQEAFQVLLSLNAASRPNVAVDRLLIELNHRPEALDLADKRGFWSDHPELESGRGISVEDWVCEVGSGNTRLGYWDWVVSQLELDREESGTPAT
jgi:hypothetical protein